MWKCPQELFSIREDLKVPDSNKAWGGVSRLVKHGKGLMMKKWIGEVTRANHL